jgi:cytochrome c peroxidase
VKAPHAVALAGAMLLVGATSCKEEGRRSSASSSDASDSLMLRSEPILPLPTPAKQPAELVSLGRDLFNDKRLSADGSVSCASCHDLAAGGDDGRRRSKGVGQKEGKVNALGVLNASFQTTFFWDGRAATLEEQIGFPLNDPLEMAMSWDDALAAIRADARYPARFAASFPDGVTEVNVRKAIAAFERTFITPSRFDRWLSGDSGAITEDERSGYELFKSVGCTACHQGVNVGGNMFQRFGVMGDYFEDRGNVTEPDYGRYNVTKNETDRFVFRVPSLRNVALTAPYFHDGSAPTLPDAVRTMARYQLGRQMAEPQVESIVKFLTSLNGELPEELKNNGGG